MKGFFLKAAIVLTIIFGVATFLLFETISLTLQDEQDLYADDFNIIENGDGGHIVAEIYASLGECASETTTTKTNGAVTSKSTDYYYVVPVFVGEDEYYICAKVEKSERSTYNRITDDTWEYLYDETGELDLGNVTANFEGTIKELDGELYDYMLEYFREAEWFENETELRSHVLQLYLEPMDLESCVGEIIVLVILLVLAVLFWILFFVTGKNRNTPAYAVNTMPSDGLDGLNMPQYSPDPYNTQYNNNGYNSDPQYNNNGYSNNAQYNNNGYNNNPQYNVQNTQNNQFNGF